MFGNIDDVESYTLLSESFVTKKERLLRDYFQKRATIIKYYKELKEMKELEVIKKAALSAKKNESKRAKRAELKSCRLFNDYDLQKGDADIRKEVIIVISELLTNIENKHK